MSSRDNILNTVKNNQPEPRDLPPLPDGHVAAASPAVGTTLDLNSSPASTSSVVATASPVVATASGVSTASGIATADLSGQFIDLLETIGGNAYIVSGYGRIISILHEQFPDARRIISNTPELAGLAETGKHYEDAHTLENTDLAILHAHFGVAENAACWITEDQMIERALPFIAQNLALIIRRKDIVANMHEAYERIAALDKTGPEYGFATFIAGPSKTADIEQSLVLGAHGPKSMTVFLLDEEISDAGFF